MVSLKVGLLALMRNRDPVFPPFFLTRSARTACFAPGRRYSYMRVGLDIGSTTIKCVVLDDAGEIVFSTYERHYSHILEKGKELLEKVARDCLPDGRAYLAISGSAGMGLADSSKVPFVQEVFATRVAANRLAPGTDCIIELGGEDAKILFLTNGTEVRMNGSCAGGTGAFSSTRWPPF